MSKRSCSTLQDIVIHWQDHSLDVVAGASRIARKFDPEKTQTLVIRNRQPVLIHGELQPGDLEIGGQ